MSVTHLPEWDITAIEIAIDLERLDGPAGAIFSGPVEPRICLVTCFALTSQLKRIVTAMDRVIPSRLPELRVAPAQARSVVTRRDDPGATLPGAVTIAPMLNLLRLQQRLIRAIEPGLGDQRAAAATNLDASARFISEFIPNKTLPTFEPPVTTPDPLPMRLRATGITIYRLGRGGVPRSILGHWAYAQNTRGSVHLRSGP